MGACSETLLGLNKLVSNAEFGGDNAGKLILIRLGIEGLGCQYQRGRGRVSAL